MDQIQKAIECNQLHREEQIEIIEKGKALPIGTIKKRPNGNFIKTAQGWKYHSSLKGGSKSGSDKSEINKLMSEKIHGNHNADSELLKKLDRFIQNEKNSISDRAKAVRAYDKVMGEDTPSGSDKETVEEYIQSVNEDNYVPSKPSADVPMSNSLRTFLDKHGFSDEEMKDHEFIADSIHNYTDYMGEDAGEYTQEQAISLAKKYQKERSGLDRPYKNKTKQELHKLADKKAGSDRREAIRELGLRYQDEIGRPADSMNALDRKEPKVDPSRKEKPKAGGIKDLESHINDLPSRRMGSIDIDYSITEHKSDILLRVSANGKRGNPSSADRAAMKAPLPSLPKGYEYVDKKPLNMYSRKEVTENSIKEADKMYDDRGYTDSEFYGEVVYKIKKK